MGWYCGDDAAISLKLLTCLGGACKPGCQSRVSVWVHVCLAVLGVLAWHCGGVRVASCDGAHAGLMPNMGRCTGPVESGEAAESGQRTARSMLHRGQGCVRGRVGQRAAGGIGCMPNRKSVPVPCAHEIRAHPKSTRASNTGEPIEDSERRSQRQAGSVEYTGAVPVRAHASHMTHTQRLLLQL